MGAMGAGIAQVCAQCGMEVVVLEASAEALKAGRDRMSTFLAEGVRRGKLSSEECKVILGRVEGVVSSDQLQDSQLVIEAVVEDRAVKSEVLRAVAESVGNDVVIATNTS